MRGLDETFRRALGSLWRRGESGWLATVVAVEGSAYRHEGAKLIVGPDGQPVGLISGGCLEEDVALSALTEQGTSRLLSYALDDEGLFGLGAGCPGTVRILVERLVPPAKGTEESPLQLFLGDLLAQRPATLATVVPANGQGPVRRLYGNAAGNWQGAAGHYRRLCERVLEEQWPLARAFRAKDGAFVLIDVTSPAQQMVVFGAGDDALPLISIAREIGFGVTAVDHRPQLLTAKRLPGVGRIDLMRQNWRASLIRPGSAVVVMNHQLEWDARALSLALASPAAYIALLGPIGRSDRTFQLLAEQGNSVSAELRASVHTPAGLDIGARTPEEIAISLLAEIVASRERRSGVSLTGQRGPLHHAPQPIHTTEVDVDE